MREVFNGLTCKMRIYRMQRHDDWVDCSIAMVDVMVDAMVVGPRQYIIRVFVIYQIMLGWNIHILL